MYQIDKQSSQSPLAGVDPLEKGSFFILSLLTVLVSRTLLIPSLVLVLAAVCLLAGGKVAPRFLLKLLTIPLFFVASAVLPVLVSLGRRPFDGGVPFLGLYWAVSPDNIERSIRLLFRSLAGVMCFFSFILTTSSGQIDSLLKKLKVSPVFREMVLLIYRSIFILSDMASDIYMSQKARRGYSGFLVSFNSLGLLCRSLFEKSTAYSDQAAMALQARSCSGLIEFIEPEYRKSVKNRVFLVFYAAVLIFLYYVEGKWLI